MRISFLSTFVFAFLISASAQADFVLTPYVGYSFGEIDAKTTTMFGGTKQGAKISEISAGARFGYKFTPGVWLAVDPQFGISGKSKPKSGDAEDYTRTQVFADAGYDFSMVGVYLGYAVLNEFKFDDTKYSGGSAFKVGVNIRAFSNVAFLAEYHMHNYKDIKADGAPKMSFKDVYADFKESSLLVGLAFPFEFGGR